jgi:phosphocarrier protein HPr
MLQQDVDIINKLGLHARASSRLTQLACHFQSDIHLSRNSRRVNAKSIMGVMMLAAAKGSRISIEINGPDERDAMLAITALIANRFGENE